MGTDMANIRSGVTRLTKAVNAGKQNTRTAEKRRHFMSDLMEKTAKSM